MIRATVRLRLATSPREILTNRELACVKLAYVICPPALHSADENTTQKNTTQNQNAAETVMCDRYAAVDGSDDAEGTKAAPFNTAQRLSTPCLLARWGACAEVSTPTPTSGWSSTTAVRRGTE
jgi:hypothetical protein